MRLLKNGYDSVQGNSLQSICIYQFCSGYHQHMCWLLDTRLLPSRLLDQVESQTEQIFTMRVTLCTLLLCPSQQTRATQCDQENSWGSLVVIHSPIAILYYSFLDCLNHSLNLNQIYINNWKPYDVKPVKQIIELAKSSVVLVVKQYNTFIQYYTIK